MAEARLSMTSGRRPSLTLGMDSTIAMEELYTSFELPAPSFPLNPQFPVSSCEPGFARVRRDVCLAVAAAPRRRTSKPAANSWKLEAGRSEAFELCPPPIRLIIASVRLDFYS